MLLFKRKVYLRASFGMFGILDHHRFLSATKNGYDITVMYVSVGRYSRGATTIHMNIYIYIDILISDLHNIYIYTHIIYTYIYIYIKC